MVWLRDEFDRTSAWTMAVVLPLVFTIAMWRVFRDPSWREWRAKQRSGKKGAGAESKQNARNGQA